MKLTYVEVIDAVSIPGANGARVKSLHAVATSGSGEWFTLEFNSNFVFANYRGKGLTVVIPMTNVKHMYAEDVAEDGEEAA